jgi:transcription initiation factor TFIIIB Brf1 subunit/transcription initiation factor TFIIB
MNNDKYLDLNDVQIDNLIFNLNIDKKIVDITCCSNCNDNNLIIDTSKGHIVCTLCGVVNKEYLDDCNELYNENSNYGTQTSYFYPSSSSGTKISSKGYNRLSFLQKQNQMPYKEKSLYDVLETIQNKCRVYGITQPIIDNAKNLYHKISQSTHTKGNRQGKNIIMRCINRRATIAACLFYACKLQNEIRCPKEIADIYDLEIKHVNHGCRRFCDIIDLGVLFQDIKSSRSYDFIERFSKKLNIDKKYIDIAKDASNNIHKLKVATTHEPPSIAAGCILLIVINYNLPITKKEISDIFNISDVTISKTYRKICTYTNIILSNNITNLILERQNKNT